MSRSTKNKNKQEQLKEIKLPETISPEEQKVKMRFSEHKFYNDLNKPLYEAGKVYEVVGAGFIQRWLKRGGVIVEGELNFPEHKTDVSEVSVANKPASVETKVEVTEEVLEEVIDISDEEL